MSSARFALRFVAAWLLGGAAVLLLRASALREPHYWDAVGCYLQQARFLAAHGLDLGAYRQIPFLRPPLFTGTIAALMVHVSPALEVLHAAACAFAALCLPAAYLIARRLGGGVAAGLLGALLCLATPLFLAQAPMVQTDLPATAMLSLAWACLLRPGRRGLVGYAVLGGLAILTKESTYLVCIPAALLLLARGWGGRLLDRDGLRWRRWPRLLLRVLPAGVPGFVLIGWLLVHRALVGTVIAADHAAALGSPDRFAAALLHNFVEGGRILLWPCAMLCLLPAWRARRSERRAEILCTGLLALLPPLCFPGLLPRYMLLSLPALCALAALGVLRLGREPRRWLAAIVLLALCLLWRGPSWHSNDGGHLESSLAYRELLGLHRRAALEVAALRPRQVLADFPMQPILMAPPEDGYLPAPVPAPALPADTPLARLCALDLVVESDGLAGNPLATRLSAAGALTMIKELALPMSGAVPPWARHRHAVRIYRVRCPGSAPGSGGGAR